MCQLVGYIGDRPIAPLILKALELQEPYFGAHATGMGVIDSKGKIQIQKATGPVAIVKKTTKIAKLKGNLGIGHSRYSALAREDPRYDIDAMCHPFTNDANDIAMMHNGEVANFKEHWARLKPNHRFKSYNPAIDWITDSEVAVHMIDDEVKKGAVFDEALRTVMPKLTGQVLLCLINEKEPDTIWLANRWQPCYIGVADDEIMWVSSKIGLEPIEDELKKIYQPPKNSLIKLTRGNADIQVLDPKYKVADLKLNKKILVEGILSILGVADLDFHRLWYALDKTHWAKAYGVNQEEWKALRRDYGVSIVNPLIEEVDELISDGKIGKRIDYRAEGCYSKTPRFMYNII
jgi:glucosamine 6-phosphate synthetase-like amidotransferase/phosphosugar isomerase protein